MFSRNRSTLAKGALVAIGLFFAIRELGTFPAAWEDDSLFTLVARMLAEGKGYTLPILEHSWKYPYVLGIGPTVVLPCSLMIWLFGFSIEIARISAVLYLLMSFFLMWKVTKKWLDTESAYIATALMITLSAFVNNGKVVMGEVPALAFLFGAILFWNRPVITGVLLGLSAVTKITMGIVYPALGICLLAAILKRNTADIKKLTTTLTIALGLLLLWKYIELDSNSSSLAFILERTGGGEHPPLRLLSENPTHLLRMPFLYFGGMLALGLLGILKNRKQLPKYLDVFTVTMIGVVIVYFLSNEGWYRHILPAHILLLPYVYRGARVLLSKYVAYAMFALFIGMQFWWQVTHKGSNGSTEAAVAAQILNDDYADTKMIIRNSEIFVRYPNNPNWFFLPQPAIVSYSPKELTTKTGELTCLPELQKFSTKQQQEYGNRVTTIHQRFVLIAPEPGCEQRR